MKYLCYTGRELEKVVSYISTYEQMQGFVVLGLKNSEPMVAELDELKKQRDELQKDNSDAAKAVLVAMQRIAAYMELVEAQSDQVERALGIINKTMEKLEAITAERDKLLDVSMDDHAIANLVNCVRDVVVATPHGAQCLRERISGVLVQALRKGGAA